MHAANRANRAERQPFSSAQRWSPRRSSARRRSAASALVIGSIASLLAVACRATAGEASSSSTAAPAPSAVQIAAVQPEFLAAFDELERAVAAGDDAVARRILRGIQTRAPTGRALSMAQAFERVLDGREAVSELVLALAVRDEPSAAAAPARLDARLVLVVENTGTAPIELRPGPATLRVTQTNVGRPGPARLGQTRLGGEQETSETHSYPELRDLALDPGAKRELELARFFIDVPAGQLAVRLAFELELRSGTVLRAGRELPAMNVPVKSCDAVRWTELRHAELEPSAESLERYALQAAPILADAALEIAVRMPSADRDRALDLLAAREHEISEPHLSELVPTLRWLTQDPTLGGDADLWRAWLRARAGTKATERPKLVLPARSE